MMNKNINVRTKSQAIEKLDKKMGENMAQKALVTRDVET